MTVEKLLDVVPNIPGALCAEIDPDAWFPERGTSDVAARRVCQSCAARLRCLDWALENDECCGTWGGLSFDERSKLAHARQSAGQPQAAIT
jgi:hypothetical protein